MYVPTYFYVPFMKWHHALAPKRCTHYLPKVEDYPPNVSTTTMNVGRYVLTFCQKGGLPS